VIAKIPRFEIAEKEKQQTLYIPFLSGDTVTDILVLNNINLTEEGRSIWPSVYKSYQYLNTTLYLAEIDPLTGLKNRLKFEKLVTKALLEVAGQSDTGKQAYFAVIDIDFFKRINDSFGHLYDDEVLVLLARYMMYSFRTTDWLFRHGGEEFVVILRNETNEGALNALERFRQFIEQTAFPQIEKGQVTVSIGYSEVREVDAVTSLIDRADHALYFVKNNGRNKVASYEALIEAGQLQNNLQQADVELF
jgi:diguanylate cyclase (GGDEF)-like protein